MKGLLAGLLALCFASPIESKELAHTDNKVGGRIVLTDQSVPSCKGMFAYTQDQNGNFHTGCWTTDFKTKIFIKWVDIPMTIEYPVSVFYTTEGV
jgi:hypothetical protein